MGSSKQSIHLRVQSRVQRRRRAVGAGLFAIALASAALPGTAAVAESDTSVAESSDAEVNRSLDELSKAFASAVDDPQVRQSIYDAVAKRFDGDTDVLWTTLASKPGVQDALANSVSEADSARDAEVAIETLASSIPRFQIAVPANFESWDPATYTPLVAYMPEGVDDTTLKTVTAYDSAGNATELDAQTPPKVPVIVLGLNERTDDAGRLLQRETSSPSKAPQSTAAAAAKASYEVRMVQVFLKDNKEPWTSGSAEIAMKARSKGCNNLNYSDTNWSGLNNNLDIWAGPRYIGNTTCDVVFYWWEDDGGNYDFGLNYGGFSLGVQMDNSDDLIGGIQLPYSRFEGGSNDVSEWSALAMWTD